MHTTIYTQRLIEHRYGRPLEELRNVTRHGSKDPVLPILLRRLDSLEQTSSRTRAARRGLTTPLQRSGERFLGDRLLLRAAKVDSLEHREQAEAEAVWDLLDVRLLLEQRAGHQAWTEASMKSRDEDLMAVARDVADGLSRLNREALRRGLHHRGVRLSNHRLGSILQRLRAERGCR